VIIGIGGTGAAIVRRLKKLLRRYFSREELDMFQLFVIDTMVQEVPEGEEPLDAGEFFHLDAFDAAEIIRHLDENPYIARWWPGWPERPYRPTFAGTGAKRVRAIGRLAFFVYIDEIIRRLQAKIDQAIEINRQRGMNAATSIKFYLVGSLAGGTMSGMVTDMAYIARMLGLRLQPTAYVAGILVLDDPFLPKGRTADTRAEFSANTYAALREINHFSIVRRFHVDYTDLISTRELPDGFRPFDTLYLLSLYNARGQALESFETLADMIAAEMMVEIASPLHGRVESVLDNVRANERIIAGQAAAFSSFALSSLVYPLPGIASWCALSGHARFSTEVLLTPRRPASEVQADVLAFMQKAQVEEEQADLLLERLNLDNKGEAMAPPALSHDQVSGLPEAQLLGALQRLEENALAELAAIRETVATNVKPIEKTYRRDLHAEGEAILRDPQRGPRYTVWFLSALADRIAAQREQLAGEQAAYRAEADAYEAAWRTAKEALARALRLPRWLPWRRQRVKNALSNYVTAFNAYLNAMHQLERRTQAILCFNTFDQDTRDLARRANDLVNEWAELAEAARVRAETELTQDRTLETDYSLMHSIIGRDELRATFERHFPEMDDPAKCDYLASQFWQFFAEQVPDWTLAAGNPTDSGEGNPAAQVYYFLAEWYTTRLSGKTLIERLQEIYGPDWEHEVERRYQQTEPFWNYSLARFGDQVRNNLQHEPRLVGYGEDRSSGWPDTIGAVLGEADLNAVNNKNPHEMIFLNTSHGLPLFALRAIPRMRNAYEYIRRLWEQAPADSNPIPVHVSREWEHELYDIEPLPSSRKEGEHPPVGADADGSGAGLPVPEQ